MDAAAGRVGNRVTGSTAERARVAVRKAIVAALLRIVEVHPALGRRLHEHIQTGTLCRYQPNPHARVEWLLDDVSRAAG